MIFKFYKNFWTLPFNAEAKITNCDTFPFFIVGSPVSKPYSFEFNNFVKFNLDSLFFSNVFNKFRSSNQNYFKVGSLADDPTYNYNTFANNCSGYKFSKSISYSLLLESRVKDSNNYLPYFQFFYFLSELVQNENVEQENISFELCNSIMFDFSEFCKFIYFVGFGSNILINYSEFKVFIDFWLLNFNVNINLNISFITNFLCSFFRSLLCNYIEVHIVV